MDCKRDDDVRVEKLHVPKVKKNLKLSLGGRIKTVQVFDKKQNVGKTRVVLLKKTKSSDKLDMKSSKTLKKQVPRFDSCELSEVSVKTNSNITQNEDDATDDASYMPNVGALAWSRVGTYPFWPSLVTNEPGLDRHYKLTMVGRKQIKCYHVNFFGDNGRRSWVLATHIFPFQKRSDLEIMARTVTKKSKPKDPKHLSAYIVNSNKLNKWETAVTEAESLTEYLPDVRIEKFFEMVGSKKSEKIDKKRKLSAIKSPKIDMIHKRAKLEHKLLTPKKYLKKILAKPLKKLSPKTSLALETIGIKLERNSDEENADEALSGLEEKVLKKRAKAIDKIRQSDATTNSDIEKTNSEAIKKKTKTSIDTELISDESFSESETKITDVEIKSESRDTPSPVPVLSQAARYKRINVFRGVTKDRVCQICGKLNNVVKCKGSCFGLFHIECDIKVRQRVLARKLKENIVLVNVAEDSDSTRDSLDSVVNKNRSSSSSEEKSDEGIQKIDDTKPPDKADDAKKGDTTCEDVSDSEDKNGSTSSSHTDKTVTSETLSTDIEAVSAIIDNILDRIFEKPLNNLESLQGEVSKSEGTNKSIISDASLKSPVKKSERTLSLAEKIDLKMQEVMLSLTEQTKYSDSTTDEGSEPEDTSEVSFTSVTPDNEVKKLETDSLSEYSHLPQDSLDSTVADNQNTELLSCQQTSSESVSPETDSGSRKNSKTIKRIVKHVTADGIFDIIEEDEVDLTDYSTFKCTYCSLRVLPPCFICGKDVARAGDSVRHKCMTPQCGKYYHSECLKEWPQAKWLMSTKSNHIDNENLCCPYHNCHTCISDNPRGPNSRHTKEKLAKCIRCPTTYHINSYCIPAGTEILSTYQIMCPKHVLRNELGRKSKTKFMPHVNASWCFICSMGGSLICCETCPSSFHVECLKLSPPEGRYLCEECESGRLPLYDEIVWVKLGAYRWWPAQILFPNDVPENVRNIPHNNGEFVVKFFGSHDHYWVNRGRVFLFQEGDTGHSSSKKSSVDGLFLKAIGEATRAHKKFQDERANRAAEARNGMKPPPYTKIKVNRPVGDVRTADADTSNTTPCDCDPNWELPCGPDSDCLNRILLTECNPAVCAASTRCCNQAFEKRQYPPVLPFKTSGRGWGLKSLAPIKKGSFVIEYVGEVINEKEYRRRMKRKHEQKDENYYFLTIDKDRMIDAGPKGNVARFMNHSCAPNCETQKWTVNGDTRVGLFAIMDILTGTELTFNYNLECIGEEKKECHCKASNCSGFIGVKAKQDDNMKKRKSSLKPKRKKPSIAAEVKPAETVTCFVCSEPDAVQQCDRDACHKCYHLHCVDLECPPEGKWLCPWHSCNVCTKRTTRCCYTCINSYCPLHSEGNIRYDRVKGFICTQHDTKENESSVSNENSQDMKNLDKASEAETPADDVDFVKPVTDTIPSRRSSKSTKPEIPEPVRNTEEISSEPKEPVSALKTKSKKPTVGERKSSRLSLESLDKSEEVLEDNSTNENTITGDTEQVEATLEDVPLEKRRENQSKEENLEEVPLNERIKEQSNENNAQDVPINKRREELKEEILELVQKVTHSNNLFEDDDIENVSLDKRRDTNEEMCLPSVSNDSYTDNDIDDVSLDKRRDATNDTTASQSIKDDPKKLQTLKQSNMEEKKNEDNSTSTKDASKNDISDEDMLLAQEVPKKLRTWQKLNAEMKKNEDGSASNKDTPKNDVSDEDISVTKGVPKKLRTLQKSNVEMKKLEDGPPSNKDTSKNDVSEESISLAKVKASKKLRTLQKSNVEMKKLEDSLSSNKDTSKNDVSEENISLAKVQASKKLRTLQKSNMDAKKIEDSCASNKATSKNDVLDQDISLTKATSKKVRTVRNKSDAESKKSEDNSSNKDATKNDISDEEISLAQLKDAGNLFLKELTTKKKTVSQRSSNNAESESKEEKKNEDVSPRNDSIEKSSLKEELSDKEQNAAKEMDNTSHKKIKEEKMDSTLSDSESDFKLKVYTGKKRKLRLSLRHSSENAAELKLKSRSSNDRRSPSEDEDDKPLVSFKKIKLEINNFLNKIKDSVNMKRSQEDAKKKDREESKSANDETEGKIRRTTRHSSHVDFSSIQDSLNLQLVDPNLKKRRLSATSSDEAANASSESDFEDKIESFSIKNVNIKKLNSSKLVENSPKEDKRKKVVRSSTKKDVWRNKVDAKMKKNIVSSPANEETQSSDKEKVRIQRKSKKPRLNSRKSEEKQEDAKVITHNVEDKSKKSKLNSPKTEEKEVSKEMKADNRNSKREERLSSSTDSKKEENKVAKKEVNKSSTGIKNSLRSHHIIELHDSKSSSSEAVKMKVPFFSDDETVDSLKSQSTDSETCDSQDELNISASSNILKTTTRKKFNLSLRKSDPKTPKSESSSTKSDLKSPQNELTSPVEKSSGSKKVKVPKIASRKSLRNTRCDGSVVSSEENHDIDDNLEHPMHNSTLNDDSAEEMLHFSVETVTEREMKSPVKKSKNSEGSEKEQKLSSTKLKKFRLGSRKSLRYHKTDDIRELSESMDEHKDVIEEKIDANLMSPCSSQSEDHFDSSIDEVHSESDLEKPTDQNDSVENVEQVKRKRGRPRKYPKDAVKFEGPKRPRGRPRKHVVTVDETPKQNVESVTELYKMKLNTDTLPKNPYENHVNEVKLTANVPERHLRVVLRKHSEIDTKIDSKFLKMQNDIERDLPIRKRSKLRYEAQL
ncbi:Nuclear receptor binding SET domain protein [Carabus blaptoides fortunei]